MTRRQTLTTLGSGLGIAAATYAWSERRGLTRTDIPNQPSPALAAPLNSLIAHASLAPSGHNTQPWTVRVTGNTLQIGSDQSRWLPKVDPQNREMALSIGTFLENLLLAAPAHGFQPQFTVIGKAPTDGDLVHVTLAPAPETARDDLDRIQARRTIRNGQLTGPISADDVRALTNSLGEHAHFFPRESRQGRYLAEGTLEANKVQALRDDAQAELAHWTRFRNSDALTNRDGLTPEQMEISGITGWYVRHFMDRESVMGKMFRDQGIDRIQQQVANCGGWLVLTSPDSSLEALLETGRKTERLWLMARPLGLGIHPMTQMLEELPFRDQISRELGLTKPIQFLLRVGHVAEYPEPVSLRRPVSALVNG